MTYPPQQPGPYENQPPWVAGQPGFAAPPPPRKPKTGLIAALIIVGILVVGGGGVGAYVLLSGDDKGSESGGGGNGGGDPQAVAEKFAGAYETALNQSALKDVEIESFEPVVCADDYRKLAKQIESGREAEKSASARPEKRPESEQIDVGVKDVKVDGDSGTFKLTGVRKSGEREKDRPLDLERKDGEWRVCGLFKKRDEDGGSGPTTTKRKPVPSIRPSS